MWGIFFLHLAWHTVDIKLLMKTRMNGTIIGFTMADAEFNTAVWVVVISVSE